MKLFLAGSICLTSVQLERQLSHTRNSAKVEKVLPLEEEPKDCSDASLKPFDNFATGAIIFASLE